jgi:hypothetical protein
MFKNVFLCAKNCPVRICGDDAIAVTTLNRFESMTKLTALTRSMANIVKNLSHGISNFLKFLIETDTNLKPFLRIPATNHFKYLKYPILMKEQICDMK